MQQSHSPNTTTNTEGELVQIDAIDVRVGATAGRARPSTGEWGFESRNATREQREWPLARAQSVAHSPVAPTYSSVKPVTSMLMTSESTSSISFFVLYTGRSIRLKHVWARG